MARAAQRVDPLYDPELADLPPAMRWREWMGRVEAAIFAAAEPVPRQALARLVGNTCRLDELIAEIREELKGRPYDLVFVAGGWQHRTRPRFADAIRAAATTKDGEATLTRTENFVVAAIAYLQPVTRAELTGLAGREIGRDVLARLKQLGLIAPRDRGPRRAAHLCHDGKVSGDVRVRLAARSARDRPRVNPALAEFGSEYSRPLMSLAPVRVENTHMRRVRPDPPDAWIKKERRERTAPPRASTIRRKDEFNKPRGVARRSKFAS